MTKNYFIKCPVCGTVTRMRSPAGYIYKTPVRIHCGKCNTLLTGEFISGTNLTEVQFIPLNCEEVAPQKYDYFGEAASEMLCNKIEPLYIANDDILLPPNSKHSPVFSFMDSILEEDRIRFIDYVCYSYNVFSHWDKERIKYDLFLNNKHQLLSEKYQEDANQYNCKLDNALNILDYIYISLLYNFGGFFKKRELKSILKEINHHLSHMDSTALKHFLTIMGTSNRLQIVQEKLFYIVESLQDISVTLAPALSILYYQEPSKINKETLGISTCSFEDIKSFYQNTFEILVDCSDIIVGLDNIENRADCNTFTNNLDLEKYKNQSKGNRIQYLQGDEFFKTIFNLPVNNTSLRNAIGHSDYKYDGVKQIISFPEKTGSNNILELYLIDIAVECCYMIKSMLVFLFIIYELFRYNERKDNTSIPLADEFYKGISGQSRCPCGSHVKFKHCCRTTIQTKHAVTIPWDYPKVACFELDIQDIINSFKKRPHAPLK